MKIKIDWWLIVIFILTALTATLVFYFLLLPQKGFLFDEAEHVWRSWTLFQPLREGDFRRFFANFNHQTTGYPPLYALTMAVLFFVFPVSFAGAKATSLLFLFTSSFLLYLICRQFLKDKRGKIAGMVTVFLFLSAPLILFQFTQSMIETLGLFLILLLIYFYFLRLNKSFFLWPALVGILVGLLFLTKYNFGIAAAAALLLSEIGNQIWLEKRVRRQEFKKAALEAISLALILGTWFLAGGNAHEKIAGIFQTTQIPPYNVNSVGTQALSLFNQLFFYPRAIWTSYTFSLCLGIGLIAAFFASWGYFTQSKYRFLILNFLALFLPMALFYRFNMQDRYIFTVVPILYLLFAVQITPLVTFSWPKFWGKIILIIFGVIVLADLLLMPRNIKLIANYTTRTFVYQLPVNYDQTIKIKRLSFFRPQMPPHNVANPKVVYPSYFQNNILSIFQFVDQNTDPHKPLSIMGYFNEFPPALISFYYRQRPNRVDIYTFKEDTAYVLGFEVAPTSPYNNGDYSFYHQKNIENALESLRENSNFYLYKTGELNDLGIKLYLFKKL